ncbi:uncharacterized protein C8R40DRAFT_1264757 [Lentinula edodes]|uniref:uncharacterized protein n=1 Tax=Lentinula edodes TaxID=5353 RepID=UPI001E8CD064|nr:uncharacterized protein C8R40DRAFT_1264757 [Lentinula edodes]KAH7876100.1 hypothetical protein C8R40DRAFT_1264757 [Lentinula edodes]
MSYTGFSNSPGSMPGHLTVYSSMAAENVVEVVLRERRNPDFLGTVFKGNVGLNKPFSSRKLQWGQPITRVDIDASRMGPLSSTAGSTNATSTLFADVMNGTWNGPENDPEMTRGEFGAVTIQNPRRLSISLENWEGYCIANPNEGEPTHLVKILWYGGGGGGEGLPTRTGDDDWNGRTKIDKDLNVELHESLNDQDSEERTGIVVIIWNKTFKRNATYSGFRTATFVQSRVVSESSLRDVGLARGWRDVGWRFSCVSFLCSSLSLGRGSYVCVDETMEEISSSRKLKAWREGSESRTPVASEQNGYAPPELGVLSIRVHYEHRKHSPNHTDAQNPSMKDRTTLVRTAPTDFDIYMSRQMVYRMLREPQRESRSHYGNQQSKTIPAYLHRCPRILLVVPTAPFDPQRIVFQTITPFEYGPKEIRNSTAIQCGAINSGGGKERTYGAVCTSAPDRLRPTVCFVESPDQRLAFVELLTLIEDREVALRGTGRSSGRCRGEENACQ